MCTFVLVHGGSDGGFVWEAVAPCLEEWRHTVLAPDLPGHGDDTTPIPEITLRSYVDRIVDVLDAQREPVILVGHSSAGAAVTQAAEERPDKIATLAYLAAYLPRNGQSVMELAASDPDGPADDLAVVDERMGWLEFRADAAREAFGTDVPDAVWAHYLEQTRPEPLAPLAEPVRTTAERFGRVPRVYIETFRDRAVSPALQRRMYAAVPCRVMTIVTGHMPMLSHPRWLADCLATLADGHEERVA